MLESNVTQPTSSDEESSESEDDLTKVDGGKLSKRSQKNIAALINTKYVFPNMNILLYADNYILPCAT